MLLGNTLIHKHKHLLQIYQNYQELSEYLFHIKNKFLHLDEIEDDDDAYEDWDYGEKGKTYYKAEGFTPDYLIVDADGKRLKIDIQGYKLDAKNKRIGETPVVTYTEDQLDEVDVAGRDDYDIDYEVARWFD